MGRYEDQDDRYRMAVKPNLYKQINKRERLFHHLQSSGKKAGPYADRLFHMKGMRYQDAQAIALTMWV
jgi:hypothetical protein